MEIKPRDYYLIQRLADTIGESEMQIAKWFLELDLEKIKKNIESNLYRKSTADTVVY
jgi:23S rRNA maturation mini-RNase III